MHPCLFLRHDKAGDAIKSLRPLRALRKALPDTPFYLVVSQHNASLFENEPGFHLLRLPAHWHLLKDSVLLSHLSHQGMPAAFSRAVSLLCDSFPETDRLLSLFPATEKYASRLGAKGDNHGINPLELPAGTPAGRDESLNIALLLEEVFGVDLAIQLEALCAKPALNEADHFEAKTLMGAKQGIWVGFAPFAGLKNRSHPVARWEAFLPQATRTPSVDKFFLFGAPSDCRALERLREKCYDPSKVQLCFPSTFRTLGAYLLRLDGLVAVDSGPLHFARALGVPSLGILSGGDADRWFAALGPKDKLVKRGLFSRFPAAWEMTWAFRKWLSA
jgi:ADP-heptose:LPS heptosyltransferase